MLPLLVLPLLLVILVLSPLLPPFLCLPTHHPLFLFSSEAKTLFSSVARCLGFPLSCLFAKSIDCQPCLKFQTVSFPQAEENQEWWKHLQAQYLNLSQWVLGWHTSLPQYWLQCSWCLTGVWWHCGDPVCEWVEPSRRQEAVVSLPILSLPRCWFAFLPGSFCSSITSILSSKIKSQEEKPVLRMYPVAVPFLRTGTRGLSHINALMGYFTDWLCYSKFLSVLKPPNYSCNSAF